MKEKFYYPNEKQIRGVDEYRLVGGKGDQMHVMHLRNGRGLEVLINPDRCMDISRLTYRGVNCSYLGAVGQVAPTHFKDFGKGFTRSFTAGLFTTCGFGNVGNECEWQGMPLPHHGTLGNTPADNCYYYETETEIKVCGTLRQGMQGTEKLQLSRVMTFPKTENRFVVEDTVKNIGEQEAGVMLLYHINMGYPLLSEKAEISVSSDSVQGLNPYAQEHPDDWKIIAPPQPDGPASAYMHQCPTKGEASIFNPDLNFGLKITFDPATLPCLNEWKVSKKYDYVLGLEPGNCFPVSRPVAEETGQMDHLKEDEEKTYRFEIELFDGKA